MPGATSSALDEGWDVVGGFEVNPPAHLPCCLAHGKAAAHKGARKNGAGGAGLELVELREAVILRDLQDLDMDKEIAQVLDIPEGNGQPLHQPRPRGTCTASRTY